MTRANLCSPYACSDQHLVAEYKEIPRIPSLALSAQERGETPETYNIPAQFKMQSGHMKFFSNKLTFIRNRYIMLAEEMIRRGFKPKYRDLRQSQLDALEPHWFNDYTPTPEAIEISINVLKAKVAMKPSFYRHYGKYIYTPDLLHVTI